MNTTNKQTKSVCEFDGYWGLCASIGGYSPYRNGVGTAVATVTYEIAEDAEHNAGERYSYHACPHCLSCENLAEDEIDGHHVVDVEYINGFDATSARKLKDDMDIKLQQYREKHPISKKMIAKINKYFAIEHSDDWKKTYESIFGGKKN